MSAFMCSDEHVNLILDAVRAALPRQSDLLRLLPADPTLPHQSVQERLTQAGRMLLRENARSVLHRYDEDVLGHDEVVAYDQQIAGYVYVKGGQSQRTATPVQALKLMNSWRYQSCEHDEKDHDPATWEMFDHFREVLIQALPGYEAADWSV